MPRYLVVTNLTLAHLMETAPLWCRNGHKITDRISKVIYSDEFDQIFIINDSHTKEDKELEFLPPHSLAGSPETIESLYLKKNSITRFTKSTLSCWRNEHFKGILDNFRTNDIFMCGFCLDLDILPTALDMIQDGFKLTIIEDCVGQLPINDPPKNLLNYLKLLGVKIINSDHFIAVRT